MDILKIVKNCRNKHSTDFNRINMSLIKKAIEAIVEPFTYSCNLWFQTATFSNKMKTAKVTPVFKAGNKLSFTNYTPVSAHTIH